MRPTIRLRYKRDYSGVYLVSNYVIFNGAAVVVQISKGNNFMWEIVGKNNIIHNEAKSLRAAKTSARRWLIKHGASITEEVRKKL